MTTLEAVHAVSPSAIERARRLETAIRLLRDGWTRRDASGEIARRFSVSRPTAWRTVDAAHDMVGEVRK